MSKELFTSNTVSRLRNLSKSTRATRGQYRQACRVAAKELVALRRIWREAHTTIDMHLPEQMGPGVCPQCDALRGYL